MNEKDIINFLKQYGENATVKDILNELNKDKGNKNYVQTSSAFSSPRKNTTVNSVTNKNNDKSDNSKLKSDVAVNKDTRLKPTGFFPVYPKYPSDDSYETYPNKPYTRILSDDEREYIDSIAKDKAYKEVLLGTKHYSSYYLEHPELVEKTRTKSLLKRLIGQHSMSIDLNKLFYQLSSGFNNSSEYDRQFVTSMFTLLPDGKSLTLNSPINEILVAILKFLRKHDVSNQEVVVALLKQCNDDEFNKSSILGKFNKRIPTRELYLKFSKSKLGVTCESLLKEPDDKEFTLWFAKVMDLIYSISNSEEYIESSLNPKDNSIESKIINTLQRYDYYRKASERDKAKYRYNYLNYLTDKQVRKSVLKTIKYKVIEYYMKYGNDGSCMSYVRRQIRHEVISNYVITGALQEI